MKKIFFFVMLLQETKCFHPPEDFNLLLIRLRQDSVCYLFNYSLNRCVNVKMDFKVIHNFNF